MDSKAVAETLGIHRQTVRRLVQEGEITPSGQVGNSYLFERDEVERVRKTLYRDGLTHSEIAAIFGLTRNTVTYWFRTLGIKPAGRDRRRHRGPLVYNRETVRYVARQLKWKAKENGAWQK